MCEWILGKKIFKFNTQHIHWVLTYELRKQGRLNGNGQQILLEEPLPVYDSLLLLNPI